MPASPGRVGDDWESFAPAPEGTHPPLDAPEYRSTALRHPTRPPLHLDPALADPTELTGPVFGHDAVRAGDDDLTRGPDGEAVGQRIILTGRLLDTGGRPIASSLVEIWQANASGRYRHRGDQWPGTLDPNFTGAGRALTAADGSYRFTTIRPGTPRGPVADGTPSYCEMAPQQAIRPRRFICEIHASRVSPPTLSK